MCNTMCHHVSEGVLHLRLLGGLQHGLEQKRVLCDPLVRFGLHVPEPHPLALRVSLHPLVARENVVD